jgi:hypothetical protein
MTQARFQRSRQADTVGAFLNKKMSYGGTVQSDGDRLYSYLVVIGEWERGRIRLPNIGTFCSRTTQRHRNMLKDIATARGIELIEDVVH